MFKKKALIGGVRPRVKYNSSLPLNFQTDNLLCTVPLEVPFYLPERIPKYSKLIQNVALRQHNPSSITPSAVSIRSEPFSQHSTTF